MQIALSILSCLAVLVTYEIAHELISHLRFWIDAGAFKRRDSIMNRHHRKLDRLTRLH